MQAFGYLAWVNQFDKEGRKRRKQRVECCLGDEVQKKSQQSVTDAHVMGSGGRWHGHCEEGGPRAE